MLFTLGGLAFMFLVPALAGYISFAIADRPGIAPGFTAGAVAVFVGGGFIGGIVGGLIAGFTALWISRIAAPRWLRGLMPVVIIPLFASLAVGLLMFLLLGRPLAAITSGLTNWLGGMSGSSVIILGVILGLMMCFDLGGPVNKAAYAFATAGLNVADPASLRIMAAVMAAGMVPPLAMALASAVRPGLFTEPERENGRAAWLLGASFISEGAIPFAAADPLRVIPSMMFGGAITGALIMAFDVTLKAPHGGIFVFFAIGNLIWFLVALAVGTVAGALAVIAAKQFVKPGAEAPTKSPRWPPPDPRPPPPKENTMPAKTVTVGSAIGLHARPAAIIAEAVVKAGVPVTLSLDGGEPVDAGSALMIMTLGARVTAHRSTVACDDAGVSRADRRRVGPARPRRVGRAC